MSETCVNPAEIQEGDLAAFVDGVADEAVIQHIHRCPACARQAEELAALQAILTTKLHRFSCPDPDQLIAYQQGELQGNEKLVVAQHLRQCPHCPRELAALARDERMGLGERTCRAIEVLEAALVTPQVKAAAVRDAPKAVGPKQWVYRAGEVEIVINQQPVWARPHRWDLSGLVRIGGQVPEMLGGAMVELYRGEGLIAITRVSPRGRFAFANVGTDDYDLSLIWEDREIRLKEVHVK